jgi:hypothetical protein
MSTDLHNKHIVLANLILQLPERLNEGHALNVSNSSSKLNHAYISLMPLVLGVGSTLDGPIFASKYVIHIAEMCTVVWPFGRSIAAICYLVLLY